MKQSKPRRAAAQKAGRARTDNECLPKEIIHGSAIPQFVIDRNHKVLVWNRALEDLSGIQAPDVVGTNGHWKAFYPQERPCLADLLVDGKAEVAESYYSGKLREPREAETAFGATDFFPALGPRGKWLHFTAAVLKDEVGDVIGAVETLEDVTERILAEERLRRSEEFNRRFVEASPVGILNLDRTGTILYENPAMARIMGVPPGAPSPVAGKNILVLPTVIEAGAAPMIERALAGETVSVETIRYRSLLGPLLDLQVECAPLLDKDGRTDGIILMAMDLTEQKKTEKIRDSAYRISEAAQSSRNLDELYRLIHGVIAGLMPARNFYIALYDRAADLLSFPYFADEYDEQPAPRELKEGLTEYVLRTGEPLLASPEVFDDLVRQGKVVSIGAPSIDWLGVPLKTDGLAFGVLVVQSYGQGVRYRDEDKKILMFVSDQVAMAIKRKRAEDQINVSLREKEILLREVHHRVKNNMQIIASLLRLQANQIRDPEALNQLRVCQSRIGAMALVHEKLYSSRDLSRINFADYVRSLAVHLFQLNLVSPGSIELDLKLDDVFLDIQTAIPCGLVVNELITNALKHAFPEGRNGRITVELRPLAEREFRLLVKDDGIGLPPDFDAGRASFLGFQIVAMLAEQLDGTLTVAGGDGTAIGFTFREMRSKPRL